MSLLPTAKKIQMNTISFFDDEKIDAIKNRLIKENRASKLNAIFNDGIYIEKTLEDDEEYKEMFSQYVKPLPMPSGKLFYIDYVY